MLKLRDGNLEGELLIYCLLGKFPRDVHDEAPVGARSRSESCRHHSCTNILSVSRRIIPLLALNFCLLVLDFPGFCGGGALLLSERRGKSIQIKAALQDVYSLSVWPNLIFCPPLMSVIPS